MGFIKISVDCHFEELPEPDHSYAFIYKHHKTLLYIF